MLSPELSDIVKCLADHEKKEAALLTALAHERKAAEAATKMCEVLREDNKRERECLQKAYDHAQASLRMSDELVKEWKRQKHEHVIAYDGIVTELNEMQNLTHKGRNIQMADDGPLKTAEYELDDIKKKLKGVTQTIEELAKERNKIEELSKSNHRLRRASQDTMEKKSKLEERIKHLEEKLNDTHQMLTDEQASKSETLVELTAAKSKIVAHEMSIVVAQKELQELQARLESAENREAQGITALNEKLSSLAGSIEGLAKDDCASKAHFELIKAELEKAKADLSETQIKYDEAREAARELATKIEIIEKAKHASELEMEGAKREIQDCCRKCRYAEVQCARLKASSDKMEQIVAEQRHKIEKLLDKVREQTSELSSMHTAGKFQNEQIKSLKEALQKATSEHIAERERATKAEAALESAKAKSKVEADKVREIQKELSKAQQITEEREIEVARLRTELQQLTAASAAKTAEHEQAIAGLEAERESANNEAQKISNEMKARDNINAQLRAEIGTLEAQLSAVTQGANAKKRTRNVRAPSIPVETQEASQADSVVETEATMETQVPSNPMRGPAKSARQSPASKRKAAVGKPSTTDTVGKRSKRNHIVVESDIESTVQARPASKLNVPVVPDDDSSDTELTSSSHAASPHGE